jgi:2-methylcitrate dehydratase PrpD
MDAICKFVDNFAAVRYEDLPEAAVEAARKEVIDSLATALGGSSKAGIAELADMVKEWGRTTQSTVIAYGLKCPAPDAALVNGAMIHALDYDDGHPVAQVHIGCVVVPTCFAVAERQGGISGKEFIRAMILGADFLSRMALASRPKSTLMKSGWHPTPLYGYLGAAAMAGIIMGLGAEKMVNAIGIAYHQCAGNSQAVNDGALTKRMGPGLAARGGITAALMAERGITGAKNILEGEAGLFQVYHGGDYDAGILTAELGRRFEAVNVGDKPYPCCGFGHAFIDAILNLRARYHIQADQVREIQAYGGESSYGLCVPLEIKRNPRNTVDAQFSLPWEIATALVKGKVTLDDFTEKAIRNAEVLQNARKVTGCLDPQMNRHAVGPARVTLIMKDGKEYREEVEHCLGSIERPMTFADCADKFRECAPLSIKPLPAGDVEKVIEMVRHLEELPDATEIIRELG